MPGDPSEAPRCLERLFPAHSSAAFLADFWPGRHAYAEGDPGRLEPLHDLPELQDLSLLLSAYPEKVRVAMADKRDEHSSLFVDASAAARLYSNGMALILDRVERFLPPVRQWLNQLRSELGLPFRCEARCIVYATPPGAGNSAHFDANANFVVQLRGTKRWHLAPNRHVSQPTDRWAMNQEERSEELEGYTHALLPTEMPAEAMTFDLVPGSVLFVPRGYWHATEAGEETLALNFTYGQPTWADAVLISLRRRLVKQEGWRELVTLSAGSPGERRWLDKLADLTRETQALTADEVIEALDDEPVYLLAADGFLRVDEQRVLGALGTGAEFKVTVDVRLYPALIWIQEQRAPFSQTQLATHFPSLISGLPALLQTLLGKGLLVKQ